MNNTLKISNNIKISKILENDYPLILKSMKDEDYILEYDNYDDFHEIEYDNKIVGFYTTEQKGSNLIFNECYITKEYRGHGLICKILLELLKITNVDLFIKNPNLNIITTLLKHDLDYKINDSVIYSIFNLLASNSEMYKNPKIKKLYRNFNDDLIHYNL